MSTTKNPKARGRWRGLLVVPLVVAVAGLPLAASPASAQDSSGTTQSNAPAIKYDGPLTITRGGTYSGNWRATDSYAVYVNTEEPVILENCNVSSPGTSGFPMIQGAFHLRVTLTVRNCTGYGEIPPTPGRSAAGFFSAGAGFRSVNILNNRLVNSGGIYIYGSQGYRDQIVNIKYNVAENIDGRVSGGGTCAGTSFLYCHANFVGLTGLEPTPNVDVGWNQVINQPGLSAQEDVIIVQASQGTAQGPIRIHDNLIYGNYNQAPGQPGLRSTGSGINIADPSTDLSRQVAYSWAYNNQIVGFTNYGIGLSGGHSNRIFNNRIIASNILPDGSQVAKILFSLAINDAAALGPQYFYDNQAYGNVVADTWVNQYGNRFANCSMQGFTGLCATIMPDNKDLNNAVTRPLVTRGDEAAEYADWLQKVKDNSITLGPTGYVSPAPDLSQPRSGQDLPQIPLTVTTLPASGIVAYKATAASTVSYSADLNQVYFQISHNSDLSASWTQEVSRVIPQDANVSRIETTLQERSTDANGKITQFALTPGDTYYYRPVAVDQSGGRHYGTITSFTTLKNPTIATTSVKAAETDVHSAIVRANIGSVGTPLDSVNYVVGREPTLTAQAGQMVFPATDFDKGGGVSPRASSALLTGLDGDTDYYVRAVAKVLLNMGEAATVVPVVVEGPIAKFTTKHDPLADQLATLAPHDVIATKALMVEQAAPGFSKVEFEYSTDPQFVSDVVRRDSIREPKWDGNGKLGYNASARPVIKNANGSTSLGDLVAGTTYYYRAVGITDDGVRHYGSSQSFTTLRMPKATACPAVNVASTSAGLYGYASANGIDAQTQVYQISTDPTFATGVISVNPAETIATGSTSNRLMTGTVDGLAKATTYYYRLIGTNTYGSTISNVVSFTTKA